MVFSHLRAEEEDQVILVCNLQDGHKIYNTITDGGSTAPLYCWYHTEEKTIQEHKRDWRDVRGIVGCQTSAFAPSTDWFYSIEHSNLSPGSIYTMYYIPDSTYYKSTASGANKNTSQKREHCGLVTVSVCYSEQCVTNQTELASQVRPWTN